VSTAAPISRLGWRLLPAVVAGAAMVIAASVAIQALRSHPGLVSVGTDPAPVAAVAGQPWEMTVFPVGTRGGLSKPQRARFKAQRTHVTKVVRKVFGVLTGSPGFEVTVKEHFSRDAALSLMRTKAGLPEDTTRVDIRRRKASIGIQGSPPRTAAARVKVRAIAEVGGREIAWSDRATLWMEKTKRGWVVIAFDLKRDRL